VVYLQVVAETDKMLEVEFFNLPGKSVLKPETVSVVPGLNTKSFDVGMLPCGAYLMKITMGDLMEIRKIIVNR
jgi:hypothetical protein